MKASSNCKVLIVDDEKTNIDVLIHMLKDDYKLGVALDGCKAIEYSIGNKVDLILLDIMMPGMNGFQVCAELKSKQATCNIPVIFITGRHDIQAKNKGFEIGAVDYVTKPFDRSEVKARVKTHLNLKISQETLQNQNIILDEKVKERTKELTLTQVEILERLGRAAEYRDHDTGQHIKRISNYCMMLGKAAGLSDQKSDIIALASTMHDIGKIGIPDNILLKKGRLNEKENTIIETHPQIGAKILSGSRSTIIKIAEIISLTHHEKWDGTGYPNQLKGEDIPVEGRIVSICDTFDALVSKRPYKSAWPIEKALDEIRSQSNKQFDPKLVQLFLALEPELREIIGTLGLN